MLVVNSQDVATAALDRDISRSRGISRGWGTQKPRKLEERDVQVLQSRTA
jgi:hypothetical protein